MKKRTFKQKQALPQLPCDWLVVDISNMLFRTFFVGRPNDTDIALAGMATHVGLTTLLKYYNHFKPTYGMVLAFDRSSWRKKYTASEKCISQKAYKGNRRQNMSPSQQATYAKFCDHLKEFEQLMVEHTRIRTMMCDDLEADDLIAGFCRAYEGDNTIVLSTDTDLLQLKRYKGVRVVSFADDQEHILSDFDGDPHLYLFHKCLRGDPTDNIQSAYPRLHSKKIKAAFEDSYERLQIMKETWVDQNGRTMLVEDLFKENQLLIDLEKQPEDIQVKMFTTIDESIAAKKKFSLFHFMKFCGKYELVRVRETVDTFIPMLNAQGTVMKEGAA